MLLTQPDQEKPQSHRLAMWFGCHQICWLVRLAPVVEMPTICTTWKAV